MGPLVTKILRFCFSWIDSILSLLITQIYKLLMDLSGLVLYSDEIIDTIGKRVTLILGIFMLFKLATSVIGYIVSPDKINDSQKGGGKLIVNVVISLTLLVTINLIFKEAYNVQKTIIDSQIIEKIFFGNQASNIVKYTSGTDNPVDENNNKIRMDIGYYLYSGLFSTNTEVFGDKCDQLWDTQFNLTDDPCYDLMQAQVGDSGIATIYKARNTMDMSYVFVDWDLVLATSTSNSKTFVFNYWPIISSVAGVMILFVLISFSMDIATRAIKLLFLQIIAPIPIISYMDIGKGQDIFKKWGKECINTFLSVFIRLIALDFAVFMIVLVRGNWKDIFIHNVWMNIFIIIGCLMFAKQVPKLLEDFLGIKMDGMALNPLKKFQNEALFGKQITGGLAGLTAAGLAGGAALGTNAYARGAETLNAFKERRFKDGFKSIFYGAGSTLTGGLSAASRGIVGTAKGQKFGQVYSGAYGGAMTARINRDDRHDLGISPLEVWDENLRSSMYLANSAQKDDSKLKHYDDYVSAGTAAKQRAESEVDKQADRINYNGRTLGAMRDYYEHLKNSAGPQRSDSETNIRNQLKSQHQKLQSESDGEYENRINRLLSQGANQDRINADLKSKQEQHAEAISKAHQDYFTARKDVTNAYIEHADNLAQAIITSRSGANIRGFDTIFASAPEDVIVRSNIDKMSNIDDHYGLDIPVDIADIGKSIQAADNKRSDIRGGANYEKAQLIQQQAKKEKK